MRCNEELLAHEGSQTLAQVAHRCCRVSKPETVEGQVEWDLKQAGLVGSAPAYVTR